MWPSRQLCRCRRPRRAHQGPDQVGWLSLYSLTTSALSLQGTGILVALAGQHRPLGPRRAFCRGLAGGQLAAPTAGPSDAEPGSPTIGSSGTPRPVVSSSVGFAPALPCSRSAHPHPTPHPPSFRAAVSGCLTGALQQQMHAALRIQWAKPTSKARAVRRLYAGPYRLSTSH
jgi:hypothetical protein